MNQSTAVVGVTIWLLWILFAASAILFSNSDQHVVTESFETGVTQPSHRNTQNVPPTPSATFVWIDQPSPSPSRDGWVTETKFTPVEQLSKAPSSSPTSLAQVRRRSPTRRPSRAPVVLPSDAPSSIPSTNPSRSAYPSISESPTISKQPTQQPSTSPSTSALPTTLPTQTCRDLDSYSSPINALGCSHHNGTDCFAWRYLGLSPSEVEDLVTSCPVSCQIDCGSLRSFETNFTIQLLRVDNFLAPESTLLLEEVSVEYLTDYVVSLNEPSRFSLYDVELLSQRLLDDNDGRRTLQQRGRSDLEITVSFRGFVLELSLALVEKHLLEAMQSFGYSRALRLTNDPTFQDAQVSLEFFDSDEPNNDPPGGTPVDVASRDDDKSSFTVFVILSLITVGGVLALAVAMHKNMQRQQQGLTALVAAVSNKDNESDLNSRVVSPAASSHRSPLNLNATLSMESVWRYVSNSLSPGSKSPTMASDGNVTDRSSVGSTSSSSIVESNVQYPTSLDLSKSTEQSDEHPLTGLIPSMIVYDGIDNNDDDSASRSLVRQMSPQQRVVPSRQLAATPTLRAALHVNSRQAIDESNFLGIIERAATTSTPERLDEVKHANSYQFGVLSETVLNRRNLHRSRTSFDLGRSHANLGNDQRSSRSLDASRTCDEEGGAVSDATTVKTGAGGRESPDDTSIESDTKQPQAVLWKISPRRSLVRKRSQRSASSNEEVLIEATVSPRSHRRISSRLSARSATPPPPNSYPQAVLPSPRSMTTPPRRYRKAFHP